MNSICFLCVEALVHLRRLVTRLAPYPNGRVRLDSGGEVHQAHLAVRGEQGVLEANVAVREATAVPSLDGLEQRADGGPAESLAVLEGEAPSEVVEVAAGDVLPKCGPKTCFETAVFALFRIVLASIWMDFNAQASRSMSKSACEM